MAEFQSRILEKARYEHALAHLLGCNLFVLHTLQKCVLDPVLQLPLEETATYLMKNSADAVKARDFKEALDRDCPRHHHCLQHAICAYSQYLATTPPDIVKDADGLYQALYTFLLEQELLHLGLFPNSPTLESMPSRLKCLNRTMVLFCQTAVPLKTEPPRASGGRRLQVQVPLRSDTDSE
jgi:hypothetical protein